MRKKRIRLQKRINILGLESSFFYSILKEALGHPYITHFKCLRLFFWKIILLKRNRWSVFFHQIGSFLNWNPLMRTGHNCLWLTSVGFLACFTAVAGFFFPSWSTGSAARWSSTSLSDVTSSESAEIGLVSESESSLPQSLVGTCSSGWSSLGTLFFEQLSS